MKEISRRVRKMQAQAKVEIKTVRELVDFVLRAQRGEVSIRSAVISEELIEIQPTEARRWQRIAEQLAEKHNVPVEDVKHSLIERKPELALMFQ